MPKDAVASGARLVGEALPLHEEVLFDMKFLIIGDLHLSCTHPDSTRADQARNTTIIWGYLMATG